MRFFMDCGEIPLQPDGMRKDCVERGGVREEEWLADMDSNHD